MTIYTAVDVATTALRYAGEVSPYDVDAPAELIDIALEHLNMILAEKGSIRRLKWKVPAQQVIPLSAGTSTYAINTILGNDTPLLFIQEAHLRINATGKDECIDLIRRTEFNNDYDSGTKSGLPERVYIDNQSPDNPIAYVIPTPTDATRSLVLRGMGFPLDVRSDGGQNVTEYPDAWARCLALHTGHDISCGPIVTLPEHRLKRLKAEAIRAERQLNAYSNTESVQRPRYVKYRDL